MLLDRLLRSQGVSVRFVEVTDLAAVEAACAELRPEERAALGITDGMVRISVGIEAVEDILADLAQALAHPGAL